MTKYFLLDHTKKTDSKHFLQNYIGTRYLIWESFSGLLKECTINKTYAKDARINKLTSKPYINNYYLFPAKRGDMRIKEFFW